MVVTMDNTKLANAVATIVSMEPTDVSKNPWRYTWEKDKDTKGPQKDFANMIKRCRFYYKRNPLTSSTINKLVDIGINTLNFHSNGLTDNEFKVFEGITSDLLGFAEDMALEYLISGLVVPEVEYSSSTKEELKSLGIKKYNSLILPKTMWIRDPMSIEIKPSVLPDQPSYYVNIPEEMLYFIRNSGKYPDGSVDEILYHKLYEYSPEFVDKVKSGQNKILLQNPFVIRRRVITESPYPTPYLSSAVDILEHKRNLRRTDYSVANKVLSAILQIKVGDKDFPMTNSEEDKAYMLDLKEQLTWRNRNNNDIENIFQLFTSHVVELEWIFPDVEVLINDAKYQEINQEIMFALGFPRILITGETERSGAGDQEFASLSPIKTMNGFREKILTVIKEVVYQICRRNKFASVPEVEFEPVNFHKFADYITALSKLFDSGGLSRDSFAEVLGYDFDDEVEKRADEQDKVEAFAVPAFGETPNSRPPTQSGDTKPVTKKQPVVQKKVNNNGK